LRDDVVIYEGELESLRRFKDDVEEVKSGTECGIAVKNYTDVKPGDQIEVAELRLTALYTPGHTDDSYCFLMDDRVFTGDTLFAGGCGRLQGTTRGCRCRHLLP